MIVVVVVVVVVVNNISSSSFCLFGACYNLTIIGSKL